MPSRSFHSEAAGLAEALPALLLEARRIAAAAPGAHGRRRAGQGEAFWQFRDHRPEDGAKLVDWRRSGRGDRLFVREREREAAQTALFWLDPDRGFDWRSGATVPTKLHRAFVLCVALAIAMTRGGERVGALGGPQGGPPPRRGLHAGIRLGHDLAAGQPASPAIPRGRPILIFASDFYAPIELWRDRLRAAARLGARGALLMVSDPAEEDFPFAGRTQFEHPGRRDQILIGRAEQVSGAYLKRLSDHRAALRELAGSLGFLLAAHRTDRPPGPTLALLAASLERAG